MRHFPYIFISLFLISTSFAQTPQDPLHGHYRLAGSSEIALFSNYNNPADSSVKHQIFSYAGESGAYVIDSSSSGRYTGTLGVTPWHGTNTVFPFFDAVSGDFTGDGYDDIVAAWESANNSITIVVPKIQKGNLTWTDQDVVTLDNVLYPDPDSYNTVRFRLIKGYFDNSTRPEFAIAFWNKEGNIEIRIYSLDATTLKPVEMAATSNVYMNPSYNNAGHYDIASGDLNGDGIDEIVLAAYNQKGTNDWAISTDIYSCVDSNGTLSIVPKVQKNDFYTSSDFFGRDYAVNDLEVAMGDFEDNAQDQFVTDFILYSSGNNTYNYLLPASVDSSLDSVLVRPGTAREIFTTNSASRIGIGLVAGDLNDDGRDEIVAQTSSSINVFEPNDTLGLSLLAGTSEPTSVQYDRRIAVADLNGGVSDSLWRPEIIYASTADIQPDNGPAYSTLGIGVIDPVLDASGNITSLADRAAMRVDTVVGNSSYEFAVTAGNYDGHSVRLGTPTYFRVDSIVQPLVILNAPPTAFDVFNDTTFNISGNYGGQTGDFFSQYYSQTQSVIDFQSEMHSGWTVGSSVSGGFKIPIIKAGVQVKLDGEYGRNFSKVTSRSEITTVSQNITATDDDYIYATLVDYDVWEYPILSNNSVEGYTLVVSPRTYTNTWFPSKSPQGLVYIPDHEVGNILSYAASPSDNPALKTAVKYETSESVDLTNSPNSTYSWTLQNSKKTQVTTTNEVDWKVGAKTSFSAPFRFIPDVELRGNYTSNSISTTTNTITYTKGLHVSLGSVNLSIPGDGYTVTPYAYWSNNGALVLDYAVDPDVGQPGRTESFWQRRYGHESDPALILPWRLDNYKGFKESAEQLQETKDLIFNPDNPQPGDTVNVQLRIHNFSLINTPGPVEAQFYVGDPYSGGTLIQGIDGTTTFSTSSYIPARGSSILSFEWKFPANTGRYPKIYAVLNPNHTITEVHAGNDMGWTVLDYSGVASGVVGREGVPSTFRLSQNYPNPFNPTTTIEYSIPKPELVSIEIYDVLGREVRTIVDGRMQAGSHVAVFDGSRLASGVYFYRMKAGSFMQTKKLMLLK